MPVHHTTNYDVFQVLANLNFNSLAALSSVNLQPVMRRTIVMVQQSIK
jgi:hypothetical protein